MRKPDRRRGAAPFEAEERYLSVGAVATYFAVTDVTIKNWVDQGKLSATRTPGGHRRVTVSSVVELLGEQRRAIPTELASRAAALILEPEGALGQRVRLAHGARVRVISTDNAYAMLAHAARLPTAVIVIDLALVDGDVANLLATLEGDDALRHVAVIVVSDRGRPPEGAAPIGPAFSFRRQETEAIVGAVGEVLTRSGAAWIRAGR